MHYINLMLIKSKIYLMSFRIRGFDLHLKLLCLLTGLDLIQNNLNKIQL